MWKNITAKGKNMSPKLQPVRGTHDILPEEAAKRRFITERLFDVAGRYGFGQIETPVFEFSDVFHRTLGDTSDVVTQGNVSRSRIAAAKKAITLRPEFTAGIIRVIYFQRHATTVAAQSLFSCGPACSAMSARKKAASASSIRLNYESLRDPKPGSGCGNNRAGGAFAGTAYAVRTINASELTRSGDSESRQSLPSCVGGISQRSACR
jgi:hypothetical protein